MNHIKLIIYGIILGLTVIACGSKSSNAEASPDDSYGNGLFSPENLKLDSTKLRDDLDGLVSDLNQEIKAVKSELAYYNEELGELKAQNKIWTNPFAIYNKEIILFCAGGLRSALAAKSLKDMGFEKVSHIDGGFASMK